MSALFRSINSYSTKRENVIKEALISTLSENAKQIEYEAKQSGRDCLELCEPTTSLCSTLEAIFLHGLKDSFLWQTMRAFSGDVERRPEPSFWSPIMIFMHKQVIEQVLALSQITSEIGQCRAWIRLSLNESVFSAYLTNMRKNSGALTPYYKKYALLKDKEAIEMAAKILEGLEAFIQFNLPINSSLLNQWPDDALTLSGLWTPTLKSCPIASGVDIAGSMSADTMPIPTPQPVQTNEVFTESISNSPFSRQSNFAVPDLNQRENLELFLQKVDEMAIINEEDTGEQASALEAANAAEVASGNSNKKKRKQLRDKSVSTDNISDMPNAQALGSESADSLNSAHGNSLSNLMQTSWSGVAKQSVTQPTTPTTEELPSERFLQRSVSMTSSTSSMRSPLTDQCSYNALLRKHERQRDVCWTEVWEKFLLQATQNMTENHESSNELDPDAAERSSVGSQTNLDFEILPNTAIDRFDISELQEMVEQLCNLACEPGLDAQGFLCKSCQRPLGIGNTNFRVCALSGNYFCDDCMDMEPVLIPARIIYNWDFRKYFVSKRAALFLTEFRNQPFIDLKLLNPYIYHAAEAMAELQSLRIRLNFIRAYLHTCTPTSIQLLQRHFYGREYLYEHIHQYSIGDLAMIQRGTLNQQLQKAYKIGEAHILKCHRCSLKGFICEICKSARVLYPFHIDTTFRCETCGAVFHAHCLNRQQPCPKCERKRKRDELLETENSINPPEA